MCQVCLNQDEVDIHNELSIRHCSRLKEVPNIKGLHHLILSNCDRVQKLPELELLEELRIFHCNGIEEIPNLKGLQELRLEHCENLRKIPPIEGLIRLDIKSCRHFHDIDSISYYDNIKFNSINKIKRWYKQKCIQKITNFDLMLAAVVSRDTHLE